MNSMRRFSLVNGKLIRNKFFGLIDDNDSDKETRDKIAFLEQIALRVYITRRGHHEDALDYVQPNFHVNNYIIRLVAIVQIIRLFMLLKFTDHEDIQVYLANPFYHYSDNNTLGIMLFSLVPCIILREYILYMENNNAFTLLCTLRDIRLKGFDKNLLKLNDRQVKFYRSLFHFIITFSIRLMVGVAITMPIVLIGLRILNSEFRKGSKTLFIWSLFWGSLEYHLIFFIIGGLIDTAVHIIIMVPLYICQLDTIIENFQFYLERKTFLNSNNLGKISTDTIWFMNEFDMITFNIRYLFLFVFIIMSFIADTLFFLGAILTLNSILLSDLFAICGLVILSGIGSVAYAAGAYLDKLYVIHGQLILLSSKSKARLSHKIKTLEILDRIMGPYSGAKIGDAFTATGLLAIYFVLENASTIMLLICNVQSFMKK